MVVSRKEIIFENFRMAIGKLMSVIAEEDTVTGFLLGGIGELDKERQSNFLVRPIIISLKEPNSMSQTHYFHPVFDYWTLLWGATSWYRGRGQ